MKKLKSTLLDQINYPADLRKIPVAQLPRICDELRSFYY